MALVLETGSPGAAPCQTAPSGAGRTRKGWSAERRGTVKNADEAIARITTRITHACAFEGNRCRNGSHRIGGADQGSKE
jgi:hypothetical protein